MPRTQLNVALLGALEYGRALALQQALVQARVGGRIPDTLLLLEHPHVYTLGRGADAAFVVRPDPRVPVVRVSRGGQVTYHGPGQLVGYAILKLDGAARDVGAYLRHLEQALIDAIGAAGVEARRRDRFTGVWVGNRKIASIGVGIRRWVTYHGFAVNVSADLSYFDAIVPCGIEGCRMTSLAELGARAATVREFAQLVAACFARVFGYGAMQFIDPAAVSVLLDPTQPGVEAAE